MLIQSGLNHKTSPERSTFSTSSTMSASSTQTTHSGYSPPPSILLKPPFKITYALEGPNRSSYSSPSTQSIPSTQSTPRTTPVAPLYEEMQTLDNSTGSPMSSICSPPSTGHSSRFIAQMKPIQEQKDNSDVLEYDMHRKPFMLSPNQVTEFKSLQHKQFTSTYLAPRTETQSTPSRQFLPSARTPRPPYLPRPTFDIPEINTHKMPMKMAPNIVNGVNELKNMTQNQMENIYVRLGNKIQSDSCTEIKKSNQRNRGKYCCKDCGKTFPLSSSLSNHRFIHKRTKEFKCDSCKSSFARKSDLAKHIMTHTGAKPYSCTVCGKKFSQSSNMLTHQKRHSGIRPYNCNLCKKSFFRRVDVKRHYKVHMNQVTPSPEYIFNQETF